MNEYGFIEAPYRKVEKGRVTDEVKYLSALEEEQYFVAQANSPVDEHGKSENIHSYLHRKGGDSFLLAPTR